MFKILQAACLTATCLTLALAAPVTAQDRAYQISNGQVSSPMGMAVQVTGITVGANATTVELAASYDGMHNREQAELNGYENAYLTWSDAESDRIFLRRVEGNPTLVIKSGATMQGALVFPGVIPAGAEKVTLIFNPGRDADHPNQPGIIVPLDLKH